MSKELKQKAESGDILACYELGKSYIGRNNAFALQWLYASADKGHLPAIVLLSDFLASRKRLVEGLTVEQCNKLNNYACKVLEEDTEANRKCAYKLFKFASSNNEDALKSLIYCKFTGLGIKKNLRDAFTLLLNSNIDNTFTVLKSDSTNGISFTAPKSKVRKSIKRRRDKEQALTLLRLIIWIVFFAPVGLALWVAMNNESHIRKEGGLETEELLRGNAIGGSCLAFLVGIVWSYFVLVGITFLILRSCGIMENTWVYGLLISIPFECILFYLLLNFMLPTKK